MKNILLDNCVDQRFASRLSGNRVVHCREPGWEKLQNGVLQRAAAAEFDILLTVDRKMSFQTSLAGIDLCVIVAKVNAIGLITWRKCCLASKPRF